MICIIDIDRKQSRLVSAILSKNSIDNIISTDEQKLSACDKIIIPDTDNFEKSLRKLKLMNLMSVLRVFQKPIIGINNGMLVLCSKIGSQKLVGLGILNENAISLDNVIEGNYPIINKSKSKKSLTYSSNSNLYYFRTNIIISESQYSDSIISIKNKKITATYRNRNIYGIQMCLDNGENIGEDLLLRFAEL